MCHEVNNYFGKAYITQNVMGTMNYIDCVMMQDDAANNNGGC